MKDRELGVNGRSVLTLFVAGGLLLSLLLLLLYFTSFLEFTLREQGRLYQSDGMDWLSELASQELDGKMEVYFDVSLVKF